MAFLDKDGLLYLWQKIKGELSKCITWSGGNLAKPLMLKQTASDGAINVHTEGFSQYTEISSYGIVTNQVRLKSEPTGEGYAVTKKYVDGQFVGYDAEIRGYIQTSIDSAITAALGASY